MNVYTYFTPIENEVYGLHEARERRHLDLWSRSWRAQGWDPVILGEETAREHPYFADYAARVERHPTLNPRDYERACFVRWLAMAHVGGGMMADGDVMNYGLTPAKWERILARWASGSPDILGHPVSQLMVLDRFVPCAVWGAAEDYMRACWTFAGWTAAGNHVSDMSILRAVLGQDLFTPLFVVREYQASGWATADLVHYDTTHSGREKEATIQRVRPVG